MDQGKAGAWLTFPRPNPAAKLRLYCFPFAGSGATTFRTWWQDLPSDVEVAAIQLPGRDNRMNEPPFQRLSPLVRAIADALAPTFRTPFAFFGHSLGALVSFELTRELRRRNAAQPLRLIVSGRRPPQIPPEVRRHELPHAQFVQWVRKLGGIPEIIWREPELIAMFLRLLRADMAVNDAEAYVDDQPLDCPISAFGGADDDMANETQIDAWRVQTRNTFSLEMVPGKHFFLLDSRRQLLRSISRVLTQDVNALGNSMSSRHLPAAPAMPKSSAPAPFGSLLPGNCHV